MSKLNSPIALEERGVKFQVETSHFVKEHALSVSNAQPDLQYVRQVVKVKGSITVSF